MENCVAPGLDKFDLLLEAVLSLVRVQYCLFCLKFLKNMSLIVFCII